MTAVDTAPPLRLDRYLALLAILLALVLGLLVISERQQAVSLLPAVEGALPPAASDTASPAMAGASVTGGAVPEREALMAEQGRLAARLAETEAALRRAEAEIERLREENRALSERLEGEGAALDELARRLAALEAERNRLQDEVAELTASRDQLATELAGRPAGGSVPATPSPAPASPTQETPSDLAEVAPSESGSYRDPSAALAAQPRGLQAALEEMIREQRDVDESPAPGESVGESEAAVDRAVAAPAFAEPSRLITFNGNGGTVAEGVEAYRAGDYATAERIWGALAASGDPRAQFHFGALMYEGRTAAPDLIMAYVWLSRAVDGGHLPAIELRRQVRAAMTEAQYQEALAIQTSS
jgi:TPR repeat protein